jgi:hypothetical protein
MYNEYKRLMMHPYCILRYAKPINEPLGAGNRLDRLHSKTPSQGENKQPCLGVSRGKSVTFDLHQNHHSAVAVSLHLDRATKLLRIEHLPASMANIYNKETKHLHPFYVLDHSYRQ